MANEINVNTNMSSLQSMLEADMKRPSVTYASRAAKTIEDLAALISDNTTDGPIFFGDVSKGGLSLTIGGKSVIMGPQPYETFRDLQKLAGQKCFVGIQPIVALNGQLINTKANFDFLLPIDAMADIASRTRAVARDNFSPVSFQNSGPAPYGLVPQQCIGWAVQVLLTGDNLNAANVKFSTVSSLNRGEVDRYEFNGANWVLQSADLAQSGVHTEDWDVLCVLSNGSCRLFIPNFVPVISPNFSGTAAISVSDDREIYVDGAVDTTFVNTSYSSMVNLNTAVMPAGLAPVIGNPGLLSVTDVADYANLVASIGDGRASGLLVSPNPSVQVFVVPITAAGFFRGMLRPLAKSGLMSANLYRNVVASILSSYFS